MTQPVQVLWTPKFTGFKQWHWSCLQICCLNRPWWGQLIFPPLGVSRDGLKTGSWNHFNICSLVWCLIMLALAGNLSGTLTLLGLSQRASWAKRESILKLRERERTSTRQKMYCILVSDIGLEVAQYPFCHILFVAQSACCSRKGIKRLTFDREWQGWNYSIFGAIFQKHNLPHPIHKCRVWSSPNSVPQTIQVLN